MAWAYLLKLGLGLGRWIRKGWKTAEALGSDVIIHMCFIGEVFTPLIPKPAGTFMMGSEHINDFYIHENDRIRTRTNRSDGIQIKRRLHLLQEVAIPMLYHESVSGVLRRIRTIFVLSCFVGRTMSMLHVFLVNNIVHIACMIPDKFAGVFVGDLAYAVVNDDDSRHVMRFS